MLRFTKLDGSAFDLDYAGTIVCLDSGNDIVATCRGYFDKEGDDLNLTFCNPFQWDDWEIQVKLPEGETSILQRMITSAYLKSRADDWKKGGNSFEFAFESGKIVAYSHVKTVLNTHFRVAPVS